MVGTHQGNATRLAISPQVWITYIENLLEGIPNRQSYIATIYDLLTLVEISYFTWFEAFPQKVPALHETPCIPRQYFPHRAWSNYHHSNAK